MPAFRYDPAKGKFRSYLKTVTLHAIFRSSRQKGPALSLEQVGTAVDAAAADDDIDGDWEAEWRQHLSLIHISEPTRHA